ncbi:microsomal glutathione S-transferase 1-like [Condylostylus longicornis]|uniref:microsomal glutathione S-transferase 1-like n=1 Tax=Condylostylus longicornis TaxID=2530218 RepID=UPI00244DF4E6|nr:microsomal glutathione S-transferase 1-like [Condylostylus longicornis]
MNNTILNTAEGVINNITASFNRPLNKQFLTLENPVFGVFMFWTGLLALKMLFMSLLPSIQKLIFKGDSEKLEKKIEISRSAHRNDMENILPYFTIGLLYVCVNPPPLLATILFRFATIFRVLLPYVRVCYLPNTTTSESNLFWITLRDYGLYGDPYFGYFN